MQILTLTTEVANTTGYLAALEKFASRRAADICEITGGEWGGGRDMRKGTGGHVPSQKFPCYEKMGIFG